MRFIRPRRLGVVFVCLVLVLALRAANLSAEEITRISGKITATYTNQESIAVGDDDGHVLLLSTSAGKNVNTGKHAFMDGAQIVNMSSADLTRGCGVHHGYIEFTESGGVIYAEWKGYVTCLRATKGGSKTFSGTLAFTKGTGKYEHISGNGTYWGEFISATEYFVEWQATYTNLWKELETIGKQFGFDSHQIVSLWDVF